MRVSPQILLAGNEKDRKTLAEVKDLCDPFFIDVVEGIGRVDSEANKDDVRIRVGQGAETIVIFLASCIP